MPIKDHYRKHKQRTENDPEKMVLYDCPYCGNATLKSLQELRNHDRWCCPHCGQTMVLA